MENIAKGRLGKKKRRTAMNSSINDKIRHKFRHRKKLGAKTRMYILLQEKKLWNHIDFHLVQEQRVNFLCEYCIEEAKAISL